jgi:hypothetical protein
VGLVLAACGGGHKAAQSTTTGAGFTAADRAQITSAYEQFFSAKTPVTDRISVLQNGPKFKKVVQAFASNPLAKNVTATVSSVTPAGPDKAKVVYQVKLAGSSLPTQKGTAVRQNGTWKVGDASLCKLIALQGSTPAACKP